MGGLGYMKSHPYERLVRDARVLTIYEVCPVVRCTLRVNACTGSTQIMQFSEVRLMTSDMSHRHEN